MPATEVHTRLFGFLADRSNAFISVSSEGTGLALQAALERFSQLLGADRGVLLLLDGET